MLGSPPPAADEESARALAREIALRLRRHGITGRERLVLVDRGDGVGAMPAAQMAELAGHPQVAILLGGIAGWDGELEEGAVELEPVREAEADLEPNPSALPTRQELAGRLGDPALTLLDVRTPDEYSGRRGSQCDPRQGHIPGARNLDVGELFEGPGRPASPERVRELVGLPEGTEIVAYCHSGSRSALATLALRAAGLRRAQLRRLLARVEPPRRASARALASSEEASSSAAGAAHGNGSPEARVSSTAAVTSAMPAISAR